ncbi:MAG: DUF4369 domain-containing protein, partial [Raineya sp.]|nr:DUF4369 domain-containing protein [Raineya sp.]
MKANFIKIVLLLLGAFFLQACKKEKVILSGETENLKGKVYLATTEKHQENFWDSAIFVDSTEIQQGKFSFQVSAEKKIYRLLFAERKDFPLWVVAGETNLVIKKISYEKPTEMFLEGADEKDNELFRV